MTPNFPQLYSPGPERLAWLVEAADSDTLRAERCSSFPRYFPDGKEGGSEEEMKEKRINRVDLKELRLEFGAQSKSSNSRPVVDDNLGAGEMYTQNGKKKKKKL